jgi:hypothetical protein
MHRGFMGRMSKEYAMNRDFLPSDTKRLTYLLGKNFHDTERMNTPLKANLHSLMTKFIDKHGDVPSEIPDVNKTYDFNSLHQHLMENPGIVKKITT